MNHRYAATLAAAVPAVVVFVDCRLATELPIPAAYGNAFAALKAAVGVVGDLEHCRVGALPRPWASEGEPHARGRGISRAPGPVWKECEEEEGMRWWWRMARRKKRERRDAGIGS
jgi:hypothetical protein